MSTPSRGLHRVLDGDIGSCPECGKKRFPTRKDARKYQHNHFPGDRMSAYRCGDYWHFGHMPTAVKTSTISRTEYTQNKAKQRRKEAARLRREESRLDQGM